jgi:hypothetical protein
LEPASENSLLLRIRRCRPTHDAAQIGNVFGDKKVLMKRRSGWIENLKPISISVVRLTCECQQLSEYRLHHQLLKRIQTGRNSRIEQRVQVCRWRSKVKVNLSLPMALQANAESG